ncbi:MAG TPA: YdeI/OmpD-associated family protein [Terriglobales bacterium]|nr:YdeI/OmpD-associated family protein [Terriglobales bacterium]
MSKQTVSAGVVHRLPPDLKKALTADTAALAKWEDITPLARNEWICWVESVKTREIRQQHLMRTVADLRKGKRRPCCWMGCVHRKDKPLSPSQKFLLGRRSKK